MATPGGDNNSVSHAAAPAPTSAESLARGVLPEVSTLVKEAAKASRARMEAWKKAGEQGGHKRPRVESGDEPTTTDKGTADASNEGKDSDEDEPKPFTSLPFYGDHKRAISSLSFAPSRRSTYSGRGNASFNSNAGRVPQVLCASSSADGYAKVWDITKNLSDYGQQIVDAPSRKKPGPAPAAPGAMSAGVTTKLDPKLSLVGHSRGINDVAFSPTAAYVATASDDKTLRLWSVDTGEAFVEFRGHTNFVFSCKFNPQSNLLVSGSFDETVKLWDVRCGECVATLPAHSNPVTGVDFNRDGTCIASGSYDGLVRIWDTATGECLKTVYAEGNPPVGCVRFSPNGRFVLSGTLDGRLRLYDVLGESKRGTFGGSSGSEHRQPRGGKCSKTYAGHANSKYCAFASFLSANPKRQCIVSGSEDGKIYMYDLQSRLIRQTLEGHHDAVLAVDAHDSLELIGSGGMASDKFVRFWGPPADE